MMGHSSSLHRIDPVEHGRQLRSNYVYNMYWTPLDFGDLLSLLWRYDQAAEAGQQTLADYYRAAWEALAKALALDATELGRWLLEAQPPLMPSLPAFVERQAPFSEDLLARAIVVTNLFDLREVVLMFGVEEEDWLVAQGPADSIQDERLRRAIEGLYGNKLPTQIDGLLTLVTTIDELLYELLLHWHPREMETLSNLITHYGFPNPAQYTDKFTV